MIAAVEISQHLSSDCLQPKFPGISHLKSKKKMLQIGGRFDRVLPGSSKTFLSLQQEVEG
jgi:hypothetical protein